MINLIYDSFPYGNAEAFVAYELPFLENEYRDNYRIFSFYSGNNKEEKKELPNQKNACVITINYIDKIRAVLSLLGVSGLSEMRDLKKRVCKEKIIRCLWRIVIYRAYGYALHRECKTLGVSEGDCFVAYWLSKCSYAAVMQKKWHKNIKVYSRGHGFDVYEERCYLPFRKEIFRNINKIFLINQVENQYLLAKYKSILTEDKTTVSHLGIFLPDSFSMKINRHPIKIVSCSMIIKLKRLDMLIKALAQITDIKYQWIHIGDGPDRQKMEELAKINLCESNQNYLFIGQVTLENVHQYYKENDVTVFVNCSDTEGVPVSIMEAMSYAIPVIARDVGGNSEIVDNSCGLLIEEKENVEALKNSIIKIANMKDEQYEKLRINARKRIENEFCAEKQYTHFFEDISNDTNC